ncbi:MAG: tetratricopeptide repeat protein, partial [Pseudomonadota bacterium]
TNPLALTLKGRVQLTNNKVDEAIETLRSGLNADPDMETAQILLGLAYEADGRVSFAEAQMAQAIDRNGLTPQLFTAYRGMLLRNDKNDEAADLTMRFARKEDATPEIRREAARVLLADKRAGDAEGLLRALLRNNPNDDAARRMLATAFIQQTLYQDAVATLDDLSDEAKLETRNMQLRAEALGRLDRYDEARSFLTEIAEGGNSPNAYALLTQLELNRGNNEAAVVTAERAVAAYPKAESLYLSHYNALVVSEQNAAAEAVLRRGLEKADTTANIRTLLSNQLMQEDRREEARDILISLRDDGQLNNLTANNLAALLLDLDDDPEAALAVAKRFEGTQQPFFADTLAWAYYRSGKIDKAAEYAAIAASADIDNAEILYHQGVIAAANGDEEKARAALTKALDAEGKTESVSVETIQSALSEL